MSDGRDLTRKHLYIDCYAGIAGDMFLGAALDLGVPEDVVRRGLAALPLGGYELRVGRKRHMGLEGCDVQVCVAGAAEQGAGEQPHEVPHAPHAPHGPHAHRDDAATQDHAAAHALHPPPAHAHRTWSSIRAMLEGAALASGVQRRALDIFGRIARAEARLHGQPLAEVSFHEVGAIDSIVDIVGAALVLEHLAPVRVSSRPVPLGHGVTRCAHGTFPVPAPAALEILAGAAVEDGGAAVELCTPTGAAIIAHCAESFGQLPAARFVAAGYGAGDTVLPDRPNHLRLVLFEPAPDDAAERDAVVLEANIDDMSPEWCGHLLERLFAAGARDVWFTPIVMKKGRPALTVSALCAAPLLGAVGDALLAESTTIGYRYHAVGRRTLSRESLTVSTTYGPQTIKVARDGERVLNAAPEFEVCRAAAVQHGVPFKEVFGAALAAYRGLAQSGRPG